MAAVSADDFTLRRYCHNDLQQLRQCMRDHKLGDDPFAMANQPKPGASACVPLLEAWKHCGRAYMQSVEAAQRRCAKAVAEAKSACSDDAESSQCQELEESALRCLVTKVRRTMSNLPREPGMVRGPS